MKKIVIPVLLLASLQMSAQSNAEKMAATAMQLWPDSVTAKQTKWSYDMGVILKGMEGLWYKTGNPLYFKYIQQQMDLFIQNDGSIKGYKQDEYNIDMVNDGKLALLLYRVTGLEKYWKASVALREQLKHQPRTKEGGFWHKKIYPNQMWLDGLYMGEPFYAEYAMLANEDSAFNDIANQFIWMEKHARDEKTGLLYHAWDESKGQKWANKQTGTSPHFWARAMGWYADALVDVLDNFPANHPKRKALIDILNRLVNAIEKVQDKQTGLWYDVLNYTGEGKEKNYFEASASCQYVYAVAKGVRKGYLPETKLAIAKKGYNGILSKFIKEENLPNGQAGSQTNLYGTVKVSGLGGNPYRDGTFSYYMSEPVIVNDPKGVGAFLLAANEMELLPTLPIGKGKTVLLDHWFNAEMKKDVTGTLKPFHYVWEQKNDGGFSLLGNVFNSYGVATKTLYTAPTAENLKGADIYIIVDADNTADNPTPNYMQPKDAEVIYNWVKAGGTLVILHNDKGNAEFEHFNQLPEKFGIHFNEDSYNRLSGTGYEFGAVYVSKDNEILKGINKIYQKEIASITVKSPAEVKLQKDSINVFAVAKVGKGTVFATGDPWLYNEYLDGRRLPLEFENFKAANSLVKWLIAQSKK